MLTLFTAISLLTGAALVISSLWMRTRARQSLTWPSVAGHVIEAWVDDARLEMTKPVLRYRYEVAGRTYVGFRVAYSGYGTSRAGMDELIRPYAEGSTVKVYYNPKDPSSAVLDNTAPSDWLYWLAFGIGFLSLAAYLVGR